MWKANRLWGYEEKVMKEWIRSDVAQGDVLSVKRLGESRDASTFEELRLQ